MTLDGMQKQNGYNIKIYITVGFMSTMYASMLLASSSVTAMAEVFPHIGTAGLQQILTVNALTAAIMCLVTGVLTTRFRIKTLAIIGMLIIAIGGIGVTLCDTFSAILAWRLIYGIGMGLNHALMPTIVVWYLPESKRAIATGIKQSLGTAGMAVMTYLSGMLSILNWKYPFYVYLFSLVIAAVIFICLPKKDKDIEIPRNQNSIFVSLPKYAIGWIILIFFTQIGIYAFQTNISQLVVYGMGRTTAQTGMGEVFLSIGGIFGGAALYKVNKVLSRWTIPVVLFIYALTLLVTQLFSSATAMNVLYTDCVIHGFVYFIYNGLIVLQLGNAVKTHQQGFAVACGMAAIQMGNFVTPYVWVPLASMLFEANLPQDRLLLAGIYLILCAGIFLVIAIKKARISYTYHEKYTLDKLSYQEGGSDY